MEKISSLQRKTLFKFLEPFKTGFLKVSDIHNIYWEVSGNPLGKPVIILHGGPGGGSTPMYRGFFDPDAYQIVQLDQRGAGQSTPHACLEENTTWDLVDDIEKLRTFRNNQVAHCIWWKLGFYIKFSLFTNLP
jgi:proline iminopeptidase